MLPPLYSRRRRIAASSGVDVYEYDHLPTKIRIQVVQIIKASIGNYYHHGNLTRSSDIYDYIVEQMRREVGVHELQSHCRTTQDELLLWIENCSDVDNWLDTVEMCLRSIERVVKGKMEYYPGASLPAEDAIAEFNARMQEAAIGYQFASGEILRIDSMHMHKEIVLPTLRLLSEGRFEAAEQEYRSAHQAFRNGEYEDCIVDCGKAFESVLKIIGNSRGWPIKETDPASKLIQAAVNAGFIASYASTGLNHLKGLLESSTPTLRNKEGGHGAGTKPRNVSQELTALQIHQTAAVILYLTARDASLRSAGQ